MTKTTTTRIPQIPLRRTVFGPASTFLLRRTYAAFVLLGFLGMVPVLFDFPAAWKAFGLGLVLPGGGFLFTGDPLLAAMALLGFPAALGLWWLCGNVLIPPAWWAGTAALAAALSPGSANEYAFVVVPAGLVAVLVGRMAWHALRFRAATRRGRGYNSELALEQPTLSVPPSARDAVTEATPDDVLTLRYLMDLALQPVDRLDGFFYLRFDQFREGALRYQFNHVSYAAALYQFTHTPAFMGYLAQAQRNMVEKVLDRRTWKYWALENLWGNLRWNPDPIVDDNVMYSAYLGLQVGLYETMTGDQRYRQPGALTLRWSDKVSFAHDANTITEALLDNLRRSRAGLYPCEPNWIYPFCNTFAYNSLLVDDRLMGTDNAGPVLERARRAYDEGDFCEPDGRLAGLRSEYLGTRGPGGGNMADAMNAYWMNPCFPDLAQRTWWLVRRHHLNQTDPTRLPFTSFDKVDPGNYGLTDGFTRAALTACATEFGEPVLAERFERSLDRYVRTQNGARRYARISMWANFWMILARFGRQDAMRSLIVDGPPDEWRTGPVLDEAAYPEVMVTRAVTDGVALELVLRPGNGGVRTTLELSRLVPDREYVVTGALSDRLVADARGRASFQVDLEDRLEVRVVPSETLGAAHR